MKSIKGFVFNEEGIATLEGKYVILSETHDTDENSLGSFIGQYMRENELLEWDDSGMGCDLCSYLYQDVSHAAYLHEIDVALEAIGEGDTGLVVDYMIGNTTAHVVFTGHLALIDID